MSDRVADYCGQSIEKAREALDACDDPDVSADILEAIQRLKEAAKQDRELNGPTPTDKLAEMVSDGGQGGDGA